MAKPIKWTNDTVKLSDLVPWERNPRYSTEAQAARITDSHRVFGQSQPIEIDLKGNVVNGHQRLSAWLAEYGPDFEVDVRRANRVFDEAEKQAYTTTIHAGAVGSWNVPELANWGWDAEEWAAFGVDTDFTTALHNVAFEFEALRGNEKEPKEPLPTKEFTQSDVPDAVWPSNNDFGIPLLDKKLQADAVDLPVKAWGSKESRQATMKGTYHFYTEDYRYEALWRDPSGILNSRCINIIEPNFSCYDQMPVAVGLWQIYRKRWLACYWQSFGMRVFVDLNVAKPFYELNKLGVPNGWRAFATRGYEKRIDGTMAEYEIACHFAGEKTPIFIVYGGGEKIKNLCQSEGFIWIPEDMDVAKGRYENYG